MAINSNGCNFLCPLCSNALCFSLNSSRILFAVAVNEFNDWGDFIKIVFVDVDVDSFSDILPCPIYAYFFRSNYININLIFWHYF